MSAPVPGWYPDPTPGAMPGTVLRWWDGTQWSEHTQQTQAQPTFGERFARGYGDQSFEGAVQPGAPVPVSAAAGGVRSPMTEHVLLVSQQRKLIELTNEYDVYGQDGAMIGAVVQVGQSTAKKVVRFVSSLDQFLTHKLEVRDAGGRVHLVLTRPAKVMKSQIIVTRPDGSELGRIVQQNVFGKIKFGLEANGTEVGSLQAQNWRAWDFKLFDHAGTEVASISKTWEGLATTLFTTADKYVVRIHFDLPDPLRSLVVAAAVGVDTALKQDSRGLG